MTQDTFTYYVWIGGSCDYGHKERAGGAAVVIEHNGNIISRDVISDLHTTEFRMMLTLIIKVMQEIPEDSDILFLTNAACWATASESFKVDVDKNRIKE